MLLLVENLIDLITAATFMTFSGVSQLCVALALRMLVVDLV